MSHSKGTTNYNLPLFTKDDRPTWLTDFNSAMQEVDNVVKGLSDKVKAGGLPTSGGTMDGNINMNEHALMNVQEIELPSSGSGLYVGAGAQPTGTTGARLTSVGNANAAAFVKPDTQDSYVPVRVGTPQTGDDAVNKNSLNGSLSGYMKKSGATMTGPLILSGEPTEDLQAATKKYVDGHSGSGGVSQEYVDAQVATRLPINGGTMTGDLVLVSDVPATEHSATSKNYVLGAVGSCLPKSGGTMTGSLKLSGDPTENLGAATKQYVDARVSGDLLIAENIVVSNISTYVPITATVADLRDATGIIFEVTGTNNDNGYLNAIDDYPIVESLKLGETLKVFFPIIYKKPTASYMECLCPIGNAASQYAVESRAIIVEENNSGKLNSMQGYDCTYNVYLRK